jgi:hypothetical protein
MIINYTIYLPARCMLGRALTGTEAMPSIFRKSRSGAGPSMIERARALINEHGAGARRVADGRAAIARENGDLRQMQEWRKLGVLIDILQGVK